MFRLALVLLLILPVTAAMARTPPAARSPDIEAVDPYQAQVAGFELDPAGAERLRARLAEDPGDHVARATLMAYEHRRTYENGGSREAAEAAHELAAWFVREHPGSPPTGFLRPAPQMDPRGYVTLSDLWEEHLAEEEAPLDVLLNAASFFTHADDRRQREILTRAVEAHPQSAEPHRQLGLSWRLEAQHGGDKQRRAAAANALDHLLAAQRLAGADGPPMDADIAAMAWMAGETETAAEHARRMLADDEPGWNAGNRVYDGNRILGHLALERGEVAEAVAFLDAAGASEGSPQLNSFGPELTLAQALLDAGETEAVLRHLEAVGRFWAMDRGKLRKWSESIRAGVPVTLSRFGPD